MLHARGLAGVRLPLACPVSEWSYNACRFVSQRQASPSIPRLCVNGSLQAVAGDGRGVSSHASKAVKPFSSRLPFDTVGYNGMVVD